MIILHQLTKRLRHRTILDIPHLEIPPGFTVITGVNGSGKTSLLRILTGVWNAEGSVTLDGQSVKISHPRMGYLQDPPGFYEHLTAREMLAYYVALGGQSWKSSFDVLLHRWQVPAGPIRHFSRGQRQRLGIVCTLWSAPRYWLLDEPFTGLDGEGSNLLWQTMARRAEQEQSYTLAVLHPDHGFSSAVHYLFVLAEGQVVFAGSPRQFVEYSLHRGESRVPSRWRISLESYRIPFVVGETPDELVLKVQESAEELLWKCIQDNGLNPLDLLTTASPEKDGAS